MGALLLAVAAQAFASAATVRAGAWEEAQRERAKLEAVPSGERTRAQYDRVLDRFRAIYHQHPADVHAPASVYVVAELLTEEGRSLHEAGRLKAAVGQYEFLRTQYPASSLRGAALLAEARIEENDLGEGKAARGRYELLVKQAPRSPEAGEARMALARPAELAAAGSVAGSPGTLDEAQLRAQVLAARGASPGAGGGVTPSQAGEVAQTAPAVSVPPAGVRSGQLAAVTAIRHWSTPNYTRVVIDLGDNVTYEAARVPNPDRIYFDLHGTRLAPELAGRSFGVTDDGFLRRIRAAQFRNQMTRVVLDVNDVTEYSAFLLPNPYRLIIDIHGKGTGRRRTALAELPAEATVMRPEPRPATPLPETAVPNTTPVRAKSTVEVASLSAQPGRVEATREPTSKPISAVVTEATLVDAPSAAFAGRKKGAAAVPARAAAPTADGETSLVRALGLKIGRIVIDPGHGGHDSGTLGAEGIEEKDVVLDVALRLGRLLHDRLNAEIVYTRSDDTFVPLEDRTAIANRAQADLFLSVHANSSTDETARGVETYYLNFTTEQDALAVAARENAVSGQSIHQLSDLVKKITLKDKIEESREFAGDVEQGLYGGLQAGNAGLKNRGVKKAPFVVLIGANMPSVLAEISFVTNPRDARQLQRPEYRQRVAESLYKGVAKYASGLSSARLPVERASGPALP